MSRALVLSGGAFRGALQVPVMEYLKENYKYDAVYGVSVGSINGAMFAQDDLRTLRRIWDSVNGLDEFLASRWYWPWYGLYSMKPLRRKLKEHVSLSKMNIPFEAGVVSFTDGEYRNLSTENMKSDVELWNAIQSSSCIAGIMIPSYIQMEGKQHIGVDGGFRKSIPIPKGVSYDYLDVVTCTQINKVKSKIDFKNMDVVSLLVRAVEILEDEIFYKDVFDLVETDAEVRIFSPNQNPGNLLDASKEMIEYRYELGQESILNPLILSNK